MRSPKLDTPAGTIRRDGAGVGKLWLGRLVVTAFSLAVLGLLMSAMNPADLAAQPPPGRDVTIAGPLPLPVTGAVGISGTPSVVVSNAPSQPVPVRNLSEPALSAYEDTQVFNLASFSDNTVLTLAFQTPPAGKRLVVKHVSGGFVQPFNVAISYVGLWNAASDHIRPRMFLQGDVQPGAPGNAVTFFSLNQDVLAYFDYPDTPQMDIFFLVGPETPPTPAVKVTMTLTGYLVDLP